MIQLARVLLLCAVLSLSRAGYLDFQNDFDDPFLVDCGENTFLSTVYSVHSNHHEDRRFSLQCRAVPIVPPTNSRCFWTGWETYYDEPFIFSCSHGTYVAGMGSRHVDSKEDRIFRFNCCKFTGFHMVDCNHSGYLNQYDGVLNFTVPDGKVMRGMASIHRNAQDDRIYSFEYCSLVYIAEFK